MLTTARHVESGPRPAYPPDDDGGRLYPLLVDDTNFTLCTLAPRVHRSIARHRRVESCTRRDVDHRVIFMRIGERYMHRLHHMVRVRHRWVVKWESELRTIRPPTGKNATIGRKEERVQVTAGNLNYLSAIKAEDAARCLYNRVAVRKVDAGAGLSGAVEAPTPHGALLVDGKRVKAAGAYSYSTPPTRAEHDTLRIRAVDFSPLKNFTAELALLARTPRIYCAGSSQHN
jgi:hypothetical protein